MNPKSLSISIIVLTAIASFSLACWKIDQPGFYYDELTFVNAAVGGKGDAFMRYKLLGIPVLLMDYYGALKAWIYYPIFSLFPFNSVSVRVPAILIGIAGGMMLVAALWRGYGRFAAVAGAIMILLDPTLITHSRLDWSPNALMFFFRGLMILAIVNWLRTTNPKWAWTAVIALGLGIFDKLNFIWIGGAAVGATFIFYRDKWKAFATLYPRQARFLFWATAAGLTVSTIRAAIVAEQVDISWGERIPYAFGLLRLTLCGGGALAFISGDGLQLEKWFWPGYMVAGIIAIGGLKPMFTNDQCRRFFLWTIVFSMLLLFAFVLTKTASGVQHSSVLSGIWQFILASLLGTAWNSYKKHRKLIGGFSALAILLIAAGSIKANIVCVQGFKKPISANWDHVNTTAALFAKEHPDADYITADWGMGLQIIGVTKDKPYILDVCPMFIYPERAEEVLTAIRKNRHTYIYTRTPDFENFKGNRNNLIDAVKKLDIHYEVSKTYSDRLGRPVIEIWHVPPVQQ